MSIASLFSAFDAHKRLTNYIHPLQREAERFQRLLVPNIGQFSHVSLAHEAYRLRNGLMEFARNSISAGGLGLSEYLKDRSPSYQDLSDKYAKLYKPGTFDHSKAMIEGATRPNASVNSSAVRSRYLGITALFIPLYSTWTIYKAPSEERVWETFRMSSQVVFGTLAEWKGVPMLWAVAKKHAPWDVTKPLLYGQAMSWASAKPVLVMHMFFRFTTGVAGAGIGEEAFQKLKNYWEKK